MLGIVVLQKPGLVTCHNPTEADCWVAFKHLDQLSCEFDSLLSQLSGQHAGNPMKEGFLEPKPLQSR
jgi:hypothetical protein